MPRTQPFLHSSSRLPSRGPHDLFSPRGYLSSLFTGPQNFNSSPPPLIQSVLHPGTESSLLKQDRLGPFFAHNPALAPIPLRVKVEVPPITPKLSHDLPPLTSLSLSPATLPTYSALAAAGAHPRAFAPAILSCTCLERSFPHTPSPPSGFCSSTILSNSLPWPPLY